MREPNRLYDFYRELQTIHIGYFPDWRFGQLMSNFFGWLVSEKNVDIFFPEEEKMVEYLKEYTESLGNEIISL